jgi:hypothetical protein
LRIGGKETRTIIAQVEFQERKQGKDEGVIKFELKEKKERNHGNSSLSSKRKRNQGSSSLNSISSSKKERLGQQ